MFLAKRLLAAAALWMGCSEPSFAPAETSQAELSPADRATSEAPTGGVVFAPAETSPAELGPANQATREAPTGGVVFAPNPLVDDLAEENASAGRQALRTLLSGCWMPWDGERWEFLRSEGRRLGHQRSFEPERLRTRFGSANPPNQHRSSVEWIDDRGAAQVECGPVTQHGQFCILSADDGALTVRLYARGHGQNSRRGRLISTTTATRCGTSAQGTETQQPRVEP